MNAGKRILINHWFRNLQNETFSKAHVTLMACCQDRHDVNGAISELKALYEVHTLVLIFNEGAAIF